MTTAAAWIAETRDHLDGPRTEEANQLDGAYTAGSETMVLRNALGNVAAGGFLSVGTNTLLVMDVDTATKTATVMGGQRGSTDQDAADGALVRVNPRFTDYQILRELNRHLASMSSPRNGLFRAASILLDDYSTVQEAYDLPVSGLIRVLEVRRQASGASMSWPKVRPEMWDLDRNADTTDFPTGIALRVREGETGFGVQVVYARTFTAMTTLDDVSVTGLSAEQEDIPPLGAAIRLMSGREISRNAGSQGDTRRPDEVPPGAVGRSYLGLMDQWQSRVREESARLRAQYPVGR